MNADKYIKTETTVEKVIMLLKSKSKLNTTLLLIDTKCKCDECTKHKEYSIININKLKKTADNYIIKELTF